MGSLPREKAGVGSAVNDTTRQVGGALGVAIIGSAVSSVYASRIADLAGRFGLDAATTDEAQSSLGSAQRVGSGLGAQASAFVDEANKVFVDAMAIGMRVSVVVDRLRRRDGLEVPPCSRARTTCGHCPGRASCRRRGRAESPTASPWHPPPRRRSRREIDAGTAMSPTARTAEATMEAMAAWMSCRRAAPRSAAVGRGRRGRAGGDRRAGGRGRREPAVDGRCRGTGEGLEGHDLPALGVEGSARARRAAGGDGADRGRRHRLAARRPRALPQRARRPLPQRQDPRRAAAPDRCRVPRRQPAVLARRLHADPACAAAVDPGTGAGRAASSPRTPTSTC